MPYIGTPEIAGGPEGPIDGGVVSGGKMIPPPPHSVKQGDAIWQQSCGGRQGFRNGGAGFGSGCGGQKDDGGGGGGGGLAGY